MAIKGSCSRVGKTTAANFIDLPDIGLKSGGASDFFSLEFGKRPNQQITLVNRFSSDQLSRIRVGTKPFSENFRACFI